MKHIVFLASLAVAFLVAGLPRVHAQSNPYSFSAIINQNQQRPDGGGTFGGVGASIDGTTVVFRTPEGGPPDSIWTCDLSGNNLTKIADTTTATPGFPGAHFVSFSFNDNNNNAQGLYARDGTVVFYGISEDANNNTRKGFYAMTEAGGNLTLLVDSATMVPGGTGPFSVLSTDYSVDGGQVAFEGSGPGNDGIFSVKLDGTGLIAVADDAHQFQTNGYTVGGFFGPSLKHGEVTSLAGNGFDFSQGVNVLLVAPTDGSFDYTDLFFSGYRTAGQTLPGDTNPNYHTALSSARIDGNTVVFAAGDDGSGGVNFGFYAVPIGGGMPSKLVDQSDVLPGNGVLGELRNYVAVDGEVIFLADGNGGTPALYSYQGGYITRLFGAGDMILGNTPDYQSGISPGTYDQGRILLTTGQRFNQSLSVAIPGVPTFISPATATGEVGVAFSYRIVATGSPSSYGAQGLPDGLSVDAGTGLISGTPQTAGTYTVTLTANNVTGQGSGRLTLTVQAAGTPLINSAPTALAMQGAAFSYQITASNSPTSFAAPGLPTGLTLNPTTGLISGTPKNAGTATVTVTATNGTGSGSLRLTITIQAAPPVVTSATTAVAKQGTAFSYQITATYKPTSYGASGLPTGLTLDTSKGLITGTPKNAGTAAVTISATNAAGTGTARLTITIQASAPVITSATSASATQGKAFSYQITAANDPTSYSAPGLPTGLSINTTTGLITGTPKNIGKAEVTISATNATGTGTTKLTITIAEPAPVITSATTASATQNEAFSYQITATESPTSYAASGLPTGLSVSTSTGLITGTPKNVGKAAVTISATNATGTGTGKITLTIAAP